MNKITKWFVFVCSFYPNCVCWDKFRVFLVLHPSVSLAFLLEAAKGQGNNQHTKLLFMSG